MGIAVPGFLTYPNLANILAQSSVLIVLALGQMLAIVTRGFDISVGAVASLTTVVVVQAATAFGEPAAICIGVVAGLLIGALNGYFIAYQGLQPIVVTLGTALIVRGLGTALFESAENPSLPEGSMLQAMAYSAVGRVPVLVVLAVILCLAAWALVRRTPYGKWLYMVGGNPEAADLVGVPVRATQMTAYALCGASAAAAGMILLARSGTATAIEGSGMEMQAIAACVIGGIALSGGKGAVWQAVLGALFIQALLNGLNLTGASPFASEIVLGAVIVLAGGLDYVLRRYK